MPISLGGMTPVEPLITEVLASFVPGERGLIGPVALPTLRVSGDAHDGKIWVEALGPFMGQPNLDLRRAPNSNYAPLFSDVPNTVDYECVERSGKRFVDDLIAGRSQFPIDLEVREALVARRAILLAMEVDIATLLFTAGNWGANDTALIALTGGSGAQFGASGATEIKDLLLARNLAESAAMGEAPDAFIAGRACRNRLRTANDIRAYYGNDRMRAGINDAALEAVLLDALAVQYVHFGVARRNTANPNTSGTITGADIWTDSCLFYYKDGANAVQVAGGARIMRATAALVLEDVIGAAPETLDLEGNSVSLPMIAKVWRTEDPPGSNVAVGMSWDALLTNATGDPMGHLVTDCVA